jgi:hypothetical protein
MRESRFMISKNSQQESATPTDQQTKKVSTSDIKPDSLLWETMAQLMSRRGGGMRRVLILEQTPLDHRGVPTPTVIPWPTSTSIVLTKSGARNRAQA